jgi:hypothetical protein
MVGEAETGEHEPDGVETGVYSEGGEVLFKEQLPLPPSVSLMYPLPSVISPRCGESFSVPHTSIASPIHTRLTPHVMQQKPSTYTQNDN